MDEGVGAGMPGKEPSMSSRKDESLSLVTVVALSYKHVVIFHQ